MKNPKFKTWRNFNRLYIRTKSWIRNKKYCKIKWDTSLKSSVHAEFEMGAWKQF